MNSYYFFFFWKSWARKRATKRIYTFFRVRAATSAKPPAIRKKNNNNTLKCETERELAITKYAFKRLTARQTKCRRCWAGIYLMCADAMETVNYGVSCYAYIIIIRNRMFLFLHFDFVEVQRAIIAAKNKQQTCANMPCENNRFRCEYWNE